MEPMVRCASNEHHQNSPAVAITRPPRLRVKISFAPVCADPSKTRKSNGNAAANPTRLLLKISFAPVRADPVEDAQIFSRRVRDRRRAPPHWRHTGTRTNVVHRTRFNVRAS